MSELFKAPDDGCRYMSMEELHALGNCFAPVEFDTSAVKRKSLGIQYGTLPEQLLDLYFPEEGDGPWPLIIYVHGGGWIMGTRTLGALTCIIDALDHGYAVMTVDYRLVPSVTFPEFIFDVKTAVRWARAHAVEYGLDSDRFAMIGDSAGGHISLMIGFTADRPEYEGEQYGWAGHSSAVQAVCGMYAPTDLSMDQTVWYRASQVKRFPSTGLEAGYGPIFGTRDPGLLRLISPVSLVHSGIPPVMLQHGHDDGVVAYQNSTLLAERIEKVCGPDRVLLKLYPGRNHSDPAFMTEENCAEVLEFFDRYLK